MICYFARANDRSRHGHSLFKEETAGIGAVDLCVAHGAGRVFGGLVMECRDSWRCRIHSQRVAFEAEQVDAGALQ